MISIYLKNIKPAILLAILYAIGHSLTILSRGVYWDGLYYFWILQEKRFDILWEHLRQVRIYLTYFPIRFLDFMPSPIFAFKVIVFISWFIAGISIYYILKKKIQLQERYAFFIAASYLLIPSFLSRIELSTIFYSIANMLFFLAAFLYFTAERQKNRFLKYAGYLIACTLFFIAFATNSLLVFYGGFLLVIMIFSYKEWSDGSLYSFFYLWARQYFLLIILPIIFWIFQQSLGQPYGPGANYNEFIFWHSDFFSHTIKNTWNGIAYGFFWPLIAPITILQRKIFAVIFGVTAIMFYFLTKNILFDSSYKNEAPLSERVDVRPMYYIVCGTALFLLGLVPYLAVGKAPNIFGPGFTMRHAILLPLGSLFVVLGTILAVIQTKYQPYIQIIILALFSTFGIYNYYALDMDWYRQRAVVNALRNSTIPEIQNASALIINDRTIGFNYQQRTIIEMEYQTYVAEAFYHKQFKLAIQYSGEIKEQDLIKKIQEKYREAIYLGMFPFPTNFNPLAKPVTIDIVSRATEETYTVPKWLGLKYCELFCDTSSFAQKLENELQIAVIKI